MWWNVVPLVKKEGHIVNFWIFVIIFKWELQEWEFKLYEKIHSHFVLLGYTHVHVIMLVGLSFIFKR